MKVSKVCFWVFRRDALECSAGQDGQRVPVACPGNSGGDSNTRGLQAGCLRKSHSLVSPVQPLAWLGKIWKERSEYRMLPGLFKYITCERGRFGVKADFHKAKFAP